MDKSNSPENENYFVAPEVSNRRAIFDFSVLIILVYQFLGFIHPDKFNYYLLMSAPYLLLGILSRMKKRIMYPLGVIFAIVYALLGFYHGGYFESLAEWKLFFIEGGSFRFIELSGLPLLLIFVSMAVYSVKGILSKKENEE